MAVKDTENSADFIGVKSWSSTDLCTTTDLSVGYGKVNVVHNISLNLPNAGIVSLIGANGAGKITTLFWLMGISLVSDVNGKAKVSQRAEQNVATFGLA
jgi:ABC-type branched-subunit amino acid transport system ATPase component